MSPFDRQARIYALKIPRVLQDVLLVLAYHCNSKDECWPGMRLIARESKVSLRLIPDCITRLEALGLLAVTHGNPHRATRYILKLPAIGKGVSLGETRRITKCNRTVNEQPNTTKAALKKPKVGNMQCEQCLRISHDVDRSTGDTLCSSCLSAIRKAERQVIPFPLS